MNIIAVITSPILCKKTEKDNINAAAVPFTQSFRNKKDLIILTELTSIYLYSSVFMVKLSLCVLFKCKASNDARFGKLILQQCGEHRHPIQYHAIQSKKEKLK